MFIKQLTIYGFGQFVDRQFALNEPLTCFYGENESGKSTLQSFIQFILFGLPPRERIFYQPKTSGKLGGRITIVDEKIGEYTIERIDGQQNAQATCYLPSGEIRDETWLNNQLKGFTYETYASVYSFSSLDLIDFEQMDAEDIGNVILSIGLTGAKHMYALEKNLERQLGDLFKPHGRNPVLNRQLTDLKKLQKQLNEQEKRFTAYKNKQIRMETLATTITELLMKRQKSQGEIQHLTKLLQSLPLVYDYEYHVKQLKQLPKTLNFPKQGIERYETLKESLIPLQSEAKFMAKQISTVENTIKQFQEQLLSVEFIRQGRSIVQNQSVYEERSLKQAEASSEIEQKLATISRELENLNIQLTLSELDELSFPFQTHHFWQTLHNDHKQITHETEHCTQQIRLLKEREKNLTEEIAVIEGSLLSDEERHQYMTASNKDQLAQIIEQLNKEKEKKNFVFSLSLVSSIILFVSGYFGEYPLLMVTALLLITLGTTYTYILNLSIRKISRLATERDAESLSLPPRSYDERLTRLEKDDALNYQLTTLQDELKRSRASQLQWDEKQRALEQRNDRLQQQLIETRQEYPFLEIIQLQYWPELYYTLSRLKETYENILETKIVQQQLISDQKEFEQQLVDFMQAVNLFTDHLSVDELFEKLNQWIEQQIYMKQQIKQEQSKRDDYLLKEKNLQEQIGLLKKQIVQLFEIAQVETEEHFYEQATRLEEKGIHQQTVKKFHQQLVLIFQNELWRPLIDRPLEKTLLIEEKEGHERKIHELDQRLEEKRQILADLKAKMTQLEQSDDYSTLKHQFQFNKNEFNRVAKQWAVLKTAEQMLHQTKQTYQQQHLTDVLKQTSEFFQHITDKAYTEVLLSGESKTLVVRTEQQILYHLDELSKGTLDQLYIALRLAVGKIIGSKYKFPFIIDDAFIHSDSGRAAKIVKILQELAKEQQIILFTCQQHVANHFTGNQLQSLDMKAHVYK